MKSPIPFRGELTQRQFSQVQSLLLPWWARAYVVVPVCVFVFVSIGAGWSSVLENPLSVVEDFLFALVVLFASALITWYGRKRAWLASAKLHGQVHGQVSAAGLDWNTDVTTTRLAWDKLIGFKEAGSLVLVYYAPRCAFYFPRCFFADEQAWHSFRELLVLHLAKKEKTS